jgi:hypothetical protein
MKKKVIRRVIKESELNRLIEKLINETVSVSDLEKHEGYMIKKDNIDAELLYLGAIDGLHTFDHSGRKITMTDEEVPMYVLSKAEPVIFEDAKPDFLDLDKDGDTEESMKDASEDSKDLLSEELLSEVDFSKIKEKVKSFINKGVLTSAMVASLMAMPNLSQAEKGEIKDLVGDKVEMSVGYEEGGDEETVSADIPESEYVDLDTATLHYFIPKYEEETGKILGFSEAPTNKHTGMELVAKLKAALAKYEGKYLRPDSGGNLPHKHVTPSLIKRFQDSKGEGLVDYGKAMREKYLVLTDMLVLNGNQITRNSKVISEKLMNESAINESNKIKDLMKRIL